MKDGENMTSSKQYILVSCSLQPTKAKTLLILTVLIKEQVVSPCFLNCILQLCIRQPGDIWPSPARNCKNILNDNIGRIIGYIKWLFCFYILVQDVPERDTMSTSAT